MDFEKVIQTKITILLAFGSELESRWSNIVLYLLLVIPEPIALSANHFKTLRCVWPPF